MSTCTRAWDTTSRLAIASAIVAMALSGCTGAADKSGGEQKPTTLVLASNDGAETDGALERFVQLVNDESDGSLRIELTDEWAAKGEQRVLRDVAAGKAPLGWSGTRAFDLVGVNGFQPLHAPFLIGSYPAQAAVVGDADLVQRMLASLDGSGLTGLALLADELRFPAGAEQPLVGLGDFRRLLFGVAQSRSQAAGMTALGADVTPLPAPQAAVISGLEGIETMWRTYVATGQPSVVPFVTPNVALWPRTTVIVANETSLGSLSGEERDILTRAAAEAAQWSLDHADDDVADETAQACDDGARIALASARQLAAMRAASRPVYAALRADPDLAPLLARVEELVAGNSPAASVVPDGCAYRPGDEDRLAVPVMPAVLEEPGNAGSLPGGTYRYTLTQDEIRDGVTMDEGFYVANAGAWTWTLGDGRWSYVLKPTAQDISESFGGTTCKGYYDVRGSRVDFTTLTIPAMGECAPRTWKADWHETDDGLVMDAMTDSADLDLLFGAKTWERIG